MIKTAIELFAGIGGFRVACENLGIETRWANDIDEKACKVYNDTFGPGTIQQGDIKDYIQKIPNADLITGGFPCQPFSSAGKKQGIRDPRGTLFQNIVDILERQQPHFFVLENVKRLLTMENGFHFATILDSLSALGYWLEWRVLNAINFGLPQNRERIVITGVKNKENTNSYLLTAEDSKELPSELISRLVYNQWHDISQHGEKFPLWGFAYNGKFIGHDVIKFSAKKPIKNLEAVMQNESEVSKTFFHHDETVKRLKNSTKINKFINGVEIIYNQSGGARMGYTIFGTKGLAPTLTASTSRHYERYAINNSFRRLTNIEYARIQGFKDDHCKAVSPYDQYKLFGNAVPPHLVQWVISRLKNDQQHALHSSSYQLNLMYGTKRTARDLATKVG